MKNFRLREKFRAALLSGVAAFCLTTGCTPNLPEEQPPERQKTEWVPSNERKTPSQEEHRVSDLGNRQNQTPRLPVHQVENLPPADHSDPAPVVETDTLKAATVPVSPPLEQAPVNVIPNINLAQTPIKTDPVKIHLPKTPDTKWKFKVYASHAFTHYFPSDITMKTSRYDVKIKDYEWHSRDGNNWFNPKTWAMPGNNPFQVFDEPTNTVTFTMEKNADIFFVSAFHPKFYQNPGQEKLIQGTVDGVPVDHVAPVGTPFHGYVQVPGEMKLGRNENTYRQMEYEIGYAHRFNLLSSRKFGTLSYVPGISAGFQMGATVSVVVKKDAWWDYDDYHEKPGIQGVGGSLRNKLEWTLPNERFGIFVENKTAFYHRKHGLLDGTQEFNLRYTANNVGMSFMLYNPNKRRPANCPKL